MNIRGKKDSQHGFSLLEVLISIAIFTTALLGASVMLLSTIKGNSKSIQLTCATQLATRQIEEIMLMNYNDIVDIDKDGVNGLDDYDAIGADKSDLNVEAGGIGKRYNLYWNVAEDWPVNNTKTIRVIVTWQDGGRNKKTRFDFIRIAEG